MRALPIRNMVFDHPKFGISVTIECVTRVPYNTGSLFVRWNVTDSARPDAHGRTSSSRLHRTEAQFNHTVRFKQRIGVRNSSRYLRTCMIKFEVVWEPLDSRAVTIGTLSLDLSQFVREKRPGDGLPGILRPDRSHSGDSSGDSRERLRGAPGRGVPPEVGLSNGDSRGERGPYGRRMLYILHGTRTNSLIGLEIKADYLHGGEDFKVPSFDAPALNYNNSNVAADLNDDEEPANPVEGMKKASSKNGREKLRQLRADVYAELRQNEAHKMDLDSEWLNMDKFLGGHKTRAIPKEAFERLHREGIRDVSETVFDKHKPGTPYLETEIQEQFISWNVM